MDVINEDGQWKETFFNMGPEINTKQEMEDGPYMC